MLYAGFGDKEWRFRILSEIFSFDQNRDVLTMILVLKKIKIFCQKKSKKNKRNSNFSIM